MQRVSRQHYSKVRMTAAGGPLPSSSAVALALSSSSSSSVLQTIHRCHCHRQQQSQSFHLYLPDTTQRRRLSISSSPTLLQQRSGSGGIAGNIVKNRLSQQQNSSSRNNGGGRGGGGFNTSFGGGHKLTNNRVAGGSYGMRGSGLGAYKRSKMAVRRGKMKSTLRKQQATAEDALNALLESPQSVVNHHHRVNEDANITPTPHNHQGGITNQSATKQQNHQSRGSEEQQEETAAARSATATATTAAEQKVEEEDKKEKAHRLRDVKMAILADKIYNNGAKHIGTSTSVSYIPYGNPAIPEVAFAGRAGVGLTRLLTAVFRSKEATRFGANERRKVGINYYQVGGGGQGGPEYGQKGSSSRPGHSAGTFNIAETPGYGGANIPWPIMLQHAALLRNFVYSRPSLKMLYYCCDYDEDYGLLHRDADMLRFLKMEIPNHTIVITKADLIKDMDGFYKDLANRGIVHPVITTSSKSLGGIDTLRFDMVYNALHTLPTAALTMASARRLGERLLSLEEIKVLQHMRLSGGRDGDGDRYGDDAAAGISKKSQVSSVALLPTSSSSASSSSLQSPAPATAAASSSVVLAGASATAGITAATVAPRDVVNSPLLTSPVSIDMIQNPFPTAVDDAMSEWSRDLANERGGKDNNLTATGTGGGGGGGGGEGEDELIRLTKKLDDLERIQAQIDEKNKRQKILSKILLKKKKKKKNIPVQPMEAEEEEKARGDTPLALEEGTSGGAESGSGEGLAVVTVTTPSTSMGVEKESTNTPDTATVADTNQKNQQPTTIFEKVDQHQHTANTGAAAEEEMVVWEGTGKLSPSHMSFVAKTSPLRNPLHWPENVIPTGNPRMNDVKMPQDPTNPYLFSPKFVSNRADFVFRRPTHLPDFFNRNKLAKSKNRGQMVKKGGYTSLKLPVNRQVYKAQLLEAREMQQQQLQLGSRGIGNSRAALEQQQRQLAQIEQQQQQYTLPYFPDIVSMDMVVDMGGGPPDGHGHGPSMKPSRKSFFAGSGAEAGIYDESERENKLNFRYRIDHMMDSPLHDDTPSAWQLLSSQSQWVNGADGGDNDARTTTTKTATTKSPLSLPPISSSSRGPATTGSDGGGSSSRSGSPTGSFVTSILRSRTAAAAASPALSSSSTSTSTTLTPEQLVRQALRERRDAEESKRKERKQQQEEEDNRRDGGGGKYVLLNNTTTTARNRSSSISPHSFQQGWLECDTDADSSNAAAASAAAAANNRNGDKEEECAKEDEEDNFFASSSSSCLPDDADDSDYAKLDDPNADPDADEFDDDGDMDVAEEKDAPWETTTRPDHHN